jgi:hypothetical protein
MTRSHKSTFLLHIFLGQRVSADSKFGTVGVCGGHYVEQEIKSFSESQPVMS